VTDANGVTQAFTDNPGGRSSSVTISSQNGQNGSATYTTFYDSMRPLAGSCSPAP
jgi:hypothetical protein